MQPVYDPRLGYYIDADTGLPISDPVMLMQFINSQNQQMPVQQDQSWPAQFGRNMAGLANNFTVQDTRTAQDIAEAAWQSQQNPFNQLGYNASVMLGASDRRKGPYGNNVANEMGPPRTDPRNTIQMGPVSNALPPRAQSPELGPTQGPPYLGGGIPPQYTQTGEGVNAYGYPAQQPSAGADYYGDNTPQYAGPPVGTRVGEWTHYGNGYWVDQSGREYWINPNKYGDPNNAVPSQKGDWNNPWSDLGQRLQEYSGSVDPEKAKYPRPTSIPSIDNAPLTPNSGPLTKAGTVLSTTGPGFSAIPGQRVTEPVTEGGKWSGYGNLSSSNGGGNTIPEKPNPNQGSEQFPEGIRAWAMAYRAEHGYFPGQAPQDIGYDRQANPYQSRQSASQFPTQFTERGDVWPFMQQAQNYMYQQSPDFREGTNQAGFGADLAAQAWGNQFYDLNKRVPNQDEWNWRYYNSEGQDPKWLTGK